MPRLVATPLSRRRPLLGLALVLPVLIGACSGTDNDDPLADAVVSTAGETTTAAAAAPADDAAPGTAETVATGTVAESTNEGEPGGDEPTDVAGALAAAGFSKDLDGCARYVLQLAGVDPVPETEDERIDAIGALDDGSQVAFTECAQQMTAG